MHSISLNSREGSEWCYASPETDRRYVAIIGQPSRIFSKCLFSSSFRILPTRATPVSMQPTILARFEPQPPFIDTQALSSFIWILACVVNAIQIQASLRTILATSDLAKRPDRPLRGDWRVLFLRTRRDSVLGPDEPRYAEVAREMFVRHDLITPTLGGLPWFEKPGAALLAMIAGYRIFA